MDKNTCMKSAEEAMGKGITHLEIALQAIRTGKASPSILSQIKIDYYGTPTPLPNVANVSTQDAQTLSVQPWEKNLVPIITKGEAEKAKTVLRNARREANDQIKKMQKEGFAEDEAKNLENEIQKLTEKFIKQVDGIAEAKEKEIMTI